MFFLLSIIFFSSKLTFSKNKKSFRAPIRVSNGLCLDQGRRSVDPYLGPNCYRRKARWNLIIGCTSCVANNCKLLAECWSNLVTWFSSSPLHRWGSEISYIRRLGPRGLSEKWFFFFFFFLGGGGGSDELWIILRSSQNLWAGPLIFILGLFLKVTVQIWNNFGGLLNLKYFFGECLILLIFLGKP